MTPEQKHQLLGLARQSIAYGVEHGRVMPVPDGDPVLARPGACFVTLNRHGELRGCIGSLQAWRPLLADVVDNAYKAAFEDPRFPPLSREELADLQIHLSLLSPTEPMHFTSEQDLLRQLRPGIDGLVLEDGWRRATFLPQVWESLPDPAAFLSQLKRKAGLPAHHWSDTLRAERYTVESIG